MTRKEMLQAYYIREEILMWQNRLNEMRRRSGIGSLGFEQQGKGKNKINDPTGETGAELAEISRLIKSKTRYLKKAKKEIFKNIMEIDDSLMRQICLYRCIDCLTWQEVANKIGGGNTCDSVRKKFNRTFP